MHVEASTHHTAAFVAWLRGQRCGRVEHVSVWADPTLIPPGGNVGVKAGGLRNTRAAQRLDFLQLPIMSSTQRGCIGVQSARAQPLLFNSVGSNWQQQSW
jgi:hypothetical protein